MCVSIEFHRRPSSRGATYAGSLYLRVIYCRQVCEWTLPWRLYSSEWDRGERCIRIGDALTGRQAYLREAAAEVAHARAFLSEEFIRQKATGGISSRRLVESYKTHRAGYRLKSWTEQLAGQLTRDGQERTARAYRAATRRLLAFAGRDDMELALISPELVKRFDRALRREGLSDNTISFYMRMLRAIFNKAIESGVISRPAASPFSQVFTGVSATRKRALPAGRIRELADFHRQGGSHPLALRQACALFLFSFWARGMSFVDLAFLRKSDIREGRICYRRRKTGTRLEIPLTREIRELIDWFAPQVKDSPFVFPLICRPGENEYKQYESALRCQNKRLRRLAAQMQLTIDNGQWTMNSFEPLNTNRKKKIALNLPSETINCPLSTVHCQFVLPLSTHMSRHSWATMAKHQSVPLSQISEALGHRSEKTTSIYLASFAHTVWREINHKIRDSIKKSS